MPSFNVVGQSYRRVHEIAHAGHKYTIHQRLRHQQEQTCVNREALRIVAQAICANLEEAIQVARQHTPESFSSQQPEQQQPCDLQGVVRGVCWKFGQVNKITEMAIWTEGDN